jgi:hypothetical protein
LSEAWWGRVRRARDQLGAEVGDDPAVRMVDIGLDDDGETVIVRIHIAPGAPAPAELPTSLGGIPVRVVRADYHPE